MNSADVFDQFFSDMLSGQYEAGEISIWRSYSGNVLQWSAMLETMDSEIRTEGENPTRALLALSKKVKEK